MPEPQDSPRGPGRALGWRARLARLPVGLYLIGLGPLFGKSTLLLIHTDRSSGSVRKVVLEVVEHSPGDGTWIVACDTGLRLPWCRELRDQPQATVQYGRQYHPVSADFPGTTEGARVPARRPGRHRLTIRLLRGLVGLSGPGNDLPGPGADRQVGLVRLRSVLPPPQGRRTGRPPRGV